MRFITDSFEISELAVIFASSAGLLAASEPTTSWHSPWHRQWPLHGSLKALLRPLEARPANGNSVIAPGKGLMNNGDQISADHNFSPFSDLGKARLIAQHHQHYPFNVVDIDIF